LVSESYIEYPFRNRTTSYINDRGDVVGSIMVFSGPSIGFISWANGSFANFCPPNASSCIMNGINNNGVVVGQMSNAGTNNFGFIFDSVTQNYTLNLQPNISGIQDTVFTSINDQNLVVGYFSYPNGSEHGIIYSPQLNSFMMLDNPSVGSVTPTVVLNGINNANVISGSYTSSTVVRGFLAIPSSFVSYNTTIPSSSAATTSSSSTISSSAATTNSATGSAATSSATSSSATSSSATSSSAATSSATSSSATNGSSSSNSSSSSAATSSSVTNSISSSISSKTTQSSSAMSIGVSILLIVLYALCA